MKSYISRKFPLETRTTDQIFALRSEELSMGFQCRRDILFPNPRGKGKRNCRRRLIQDEAMLKTGLVAGLLMSAHLRGNRHSQFIGRGGTSDIRGPHVSLSQDCRDSGFHSVGGLRLAQMAEHHSAGPNLPDGISDSFSRDVWSGAVNRLEHGRKLPF